MSALSFSDLSVIRRYAAASEQSGRLHPQLLELIYERGWFRMMVPRKYDGFALPLPEVVRLEEELGRADGSMGWTVTLCSGAGWFAGFFPDAAPAELFSDQKMCIAGSGTPSGQAHVIPGGYRITGKWDYASGANQATAFTANCVVWSEGKPLLTTGGDPLVRPFLFLRGEVRVLEDWNAIGLVASESYGFEVNDLVLPVSRGFLIDPAAASDDDPLYRYPFLPLAEATLAANASGMMLHFLDCCADCFAARIDRGRLSSGQSKELSLLLGRAKADFGTRRSSFYSTLDHSWTTRDRRSFRQVSQTSHMLARSVRLWSDRLYPYAGLGAARVDSEINRVWRDLHTASQHPLLVFRSR